MKWYLTSTCFVRSDLMPLLLADSAAWLSPYTSEPLRQFKPSSFSRPRSHSTSWMAAASA